MKKSVENTARFAGMAVAVALVTASSFADSRPQQMTDPQVRTDREVISRDSVRLADDVRDEGRRGRDDRDQRTEQGRPHRGRESYEAHGRVTKVQKWNGGHRVWVSGTSRPFFVPAEHWHHDRYRVGLTIRVGGFYNPAGYYDYDCWGCSGDVIRGTVLNVDNRRDIADIRLRNGDFVTVVFPRREGKLRPGDYIELRGDWTRSGIFEAYDVDLLRRYRR